LSNAIKFTPRGGLVQVDLQQVNSDVEIAIRDTGRGISPEFLPHVFERFRQADSGSTRESGGLGLGLAIVRHLVELHGGTIGVTSRGEGEGATFRLRLPLATRREESVEGKRVHPRGAPVRDRTTVARLDGVRVVAVDDDEDTLTLLREILETAGAQVTTASSAGEASKQSAEANRMCSSLTSGCRGFELMRRIRQCPTPRSGKCQPPH
jgi:hypothetical protein